MGKCVIYVRDGLNISAHEQWNECARHAKRYNLSIAHKIFDARGDRFQEAVNKAVFTDEINNLIVYNRKAISPDLEEVLFWQIYLTRFGVTLHFIN